MSLLDDVSIVVTPNGYKAGELYAVLPVPTLGAEEVTNGDFATDTSWTKGTDWTISGGTANCDGLSAGNMYMNTDNITGNDLIVGRLYEITYTVSNYTQGLIRGRVGSSTSATFKSANGTYTERMVANTSRVATIQGQSNFIGSIDNVSVKEVVTVSADMDVTRATAATRVDENGLVNYAEIVGSEEVTNGDFVTNLDGWILSASTPPTWDNGMIKMQSDGVTFSVADQSFSTISGKLYTFVFEKLINNNTVEVKVGTSQGGSSLLNLTPTTIQTYTYSFIATSSTSWIRARDGSGTTGAYLSGFSVKEVTRDNVPRIDYSGGGCPHILAEPESTNHCTFSEQPSVWTSSTGVTVTANATTSPEGTANASTVVNTATNAFVRNAFLYTSTDESLNVTTSFFLKYTNNQWVSLKPNFFTGGSNSKTWFDIQNGVLGTNDNVSSSIVDFGNGWYRCSVTHQIAPATDTSGFVFIYAVDNDNSTTQVIGQGFAAFGSQGEQLSYSTSYIPTSGSTVTRVQDQFTRDGIGSLINSEEGVLFVEMAALANDGTYRYVLLSDGATANTVQIRYSNVSNNIQALVYNSSALQAFTSYTPTDTTSFHKIAFKYKENDFALWVDGTEVGTDTSGIPPINLSSLNFQTYLGKVKQLQVYKTALTDAELATLTT